MIENIIFVTLFWK